MTSVDWMKAFLDRNHGIALRTPETASIQCTNGSNRVKVAGLYDFVSSTVFSKNTRLIPPSQIYNVN
ncbi:hypothetical protein LSH36_1014g00020 [Paralvinella palmiformis]|uniref:Uncharacterized protein n=1 Tax=Paralvinella palmiformis TaxID=53620 RepID=A0AAD9IWG4_9ANNE|nr:hypothetical protein LSH36_1014g00020 [Paralvinella palmiformis]